MPQVTSSGVSDGAGAAVSCATVRASAGFAAIGCEGALIFAAARACEWPGWAFAADGASASTAATSAVTARAPNIRIGRSRKTIDPNLPQLHTSAGIAPIQA